MKKMKFVVADHAHSRAIQEALFELGYQWEMDKQKVQRTQWPFLYTSTFIPGIITSGELRPAYDSNSHALTTLEDLHKMLKKTSSTPATTEREWTFTTTHTWAVDTYDIVSHLSRENPLALVTANSKNGVNGSLAAVHRSITHKAEYCQIPIPAVLRRDNLEYEDRSFTAIVDVKDFGEIIKWVRKVRHAPWPDNRMEKGKVKVTLPKI